MASRRCHASAGAASRRAATGRDVAVMPCPGRRGGLGGDRARRHATSRRCHARAGAASRAATGRAVAVIPCPGRRGRAGQRPRVTRSSTPHTVTPFPDRCGERRSSTSYGKRGGVICRARAEQRPLSVTSYDTWWCHHQAGAATRCSDCGAFATRHARNVAIRRVIPPSKSRRGPRGKERAAPRRLLGCAREKRGRRRRRPGRGARAGGGREWGR